MPGERVYGLCPGRHRGRHHVQRHGADGEHELQLPSAGDGCRWQSQRLLQHRERDDAGPAPSAPTITGFTPTSRPVGTSVTFNGTNFTGATAVTFNGVSATSFTVTSDTAIQATVPAGATTGPLSVTTPGGTATSPTNFTVTVTLTVAKTSNVGGGTLSSSSRPDSPHQNNCGAHCPA